MTTSAEGPIVIVFESDPRLGAALCMLITDWGFSCYVAQTPQEAVSALGAAIGGVAAVIIDNLRWQELGEPAPASLAFERAIGKRVPIVIIEDDVPGRGRVAGQTHISKPFDPDVLKHWLEANIAG